jgi:hypothetical protein
MTGGEIIAAKVIGKGLAAAATEVVDGGDPSTLQELSKSSPAMQAAADAYATRIAVKQEILLKLYKPLAKLFGVAQEYFDSGEFAADMAAKTADIPDEHLKTPQPSVAIPAMQGLGFSLDEPDLKEMYLHLLTAATDARRPDDAHPSFSDIIKQLSPKEAKLLQECLKSPAIPVARIKVDLPDPAGSFQILQSHILNWSDSVWNPSDMGPMYIDNWIRLGLIDVTYAEALTTTGEDRYSWVTTRPEFVRLVPQYAIAEGVLAFDKGILRPTDFGRRFSKAVS